MDVTASRIARLPSRRLFYKHTHKVSLSVDSTDKLKRPKKDTRAAVAKELKLSEYGLAAITRHYNASTAGTFKDEP